MGNTVIESDGGRQILYDIIDNVPCLIYWKDSDSNYRGCNRAYAEKMGVNASDFVGKTDKEIEEMCGGRFITDAALLDISESVSDKIQEAKFAVSEGNTEKWFTAQRINLGGGARRELAVLGVIYDVTDSAPPQPDDWEYSAPRENAAVTAAETESRGRTDFLSRISHELSTPLNAIIGMSHFAEAENDITKIKSNISIINKASTQLLDTINDIMDMSRIELGQVVLHRLPFDFEKMLAETCVAASPCINENCLTLRYNIEKNVPNALRGDEFRVSQIICNLLRTAMKYTPPMGEIDITARAVEQATDKATIEIRISSAGPGMSEEDKGTLSKEIERLNDGEYRHHGETGLGLTIAKKIIEMMDGKIWIEATEKGSSFNFTVQMDVFGYDKSFSVSDGAQIDDLRVLFVSCEEEPRDNFLSLMDANNIKAVCAEDGESALSVIKRSGESGVNYSIAIIDYQMPGLNGIETAKCVRQISSKITIAVMTSISEWTLIKEEALNAGFDNFLPKPPTASQIMDLINGIVSQGSPPEKQRTEDIKVEAKDERSISFEKYSPYINVEDGLARVGGNKKLFITMLTNFKNGVAFADLKSAIEENDMGKIQRNYDTLKSVALNLSLTKLYKMLILSESQIKNRIHQKKALASVDEKILETNQKITELINEWE